VRRTVVENLVNKNDEFLSGEEKASIFGRRREKDNAHPGKRAMVGTASNGTYDPTREGKPGKTLSNYLALIAWEKGTSPDQTQEREGKRGMGDIDWLLKCKEERRSLNPARWKSHLIHSILPPGAGIICDERESEASTQSQQRRSSGKKQSQHLRAHSTEREDQKKC